MGHKHSTQNENENLPVHLNGPGDYLNLTMIALALVIFSLILLWVRKIVRKKSGAKTLTFAFHHNTKDGEQVRVVGNVKELGNWNASRGAKLKLVKQEGDDPVWVTQIDVMFPPNQPIEYKYVLMTCEGWRTKFKEWEPCSNRVLDGKNDGGAVTLHQCWGGRDTVGKSLVVGKGPMDYLTQPLIGG